MRLLTRPRPGTPATFDRLRDEFDRALANWWGDNGDFEKLFSVSEWQPNVDISESDNGLEVKVDLPGVKPEDIDISVVNDRLTIQGQRKEEKETKEKTFHRVERRYGSFYRQIPLPAGSNSEDVSAESDNGVITIRVPKTQEAKAKKVSVKPK